MIDEFFETMLGDFLDESEEHLTSLNENLLKLDEWVHALDETGEAQIDAELMNEMFRSAHSLKGLSAMMGLGNINSLTHKVENVFDAARNEQLRLTPGIIERVFCAVDKLGQMVAALKLPDAPVIEADDIASSIAEALRDAGVERAVGSQADIEEAIGGEPVADEEAELVSPGDALEIPACDPFAGVEDDDNVPTNYLEIFIDEASTALDSVTDLLVDIGDTPDARVANELLVVAHRIKGCAASVGRCRAAKLAHFMEDILQELREDKRPVTPALATALLACVDGLRRYIDQLRTGVPESAHFADLVGELQASYVAETGVLASRKSSEPVSSTSLAPTEWKTVREALRAIAPPGTTGLIGRVHLSPGQPLPGLKGRLIHEKLSQVGEVFQADPPEANIEDMDDLQMLSFGICTDRSIDELRQMIDISGIEHIDLEPFGNDRAARQAEVASGDETREIAMTTQACPAGEAEASKPAVEERDSAPRAKQQTSAPTEASKPAETIRVDIERLDHLMNLAGQLVINKARFAQISDKLKHLVVRKQSAQEVNELMTLVRNLDAVMSSSSSASRLDVDGMRRHIRRMQAGLEGIQRDSTSLTEARAGVADLLEAVHQLDRVSDNLQKSVMDTRMVPIGPLFSRFKRVIRDITRVNGKQVRLDILGEKTELDKRMIDELGDPLVHMIRNSADHGIESPEERQVAGKPPEGTISLNAYHSGNCIVVQVKDDGRGLNAERLLQKAIDRGIVSQTDAEKLTSHQIYQLIWEPGFSTAQQVTDISGRGMGMDIVRSAIEDLNGHIELDSTPGEGTTFTIKLPLTLAILPSLLAEIDEDVYAMPIESVVEIVSVAQSEFGTVQGQRTAMVRGRVVSVVDLAGVFDWQAPGPGPRGEDQDVTLVIVRAEGRELALVVNALIGEEDIVIKSISENYRNVQGIAGASILGDGRVSLILDVPTFIEMAADCNGAATCG